MNERGKHRPRTPGGDNSTLELFRGLVGKKKEEVEALIQAKLAELGSPSSAEDRDEVIKSLAEEISDIVFRIDDE